MADLKSILTDPSRRQTVVRDAEQLLDREDEAKSGLSGLAIKGAFKIVKGIRPGLIPDVVDGLLDDFAARLDPFYQAHLTKGGDIVANFSAQRSQIADALLGITDDRARHTRHQNLKKAYEGLRPKGKENVEAAVPGIARLVEKHAPRSA